MAIGYLRFAALAMFALLVAGGARAAQLPAQSTNAANAKLLKLAPAARAAELAKVVDHWCIGTETFLMGVIGAGRGAGNAYWSLRCADGSAWAVQVDPLGNVSAIDCDSYKAEGAGKECFKKF